VSYGYSTTSQIAVEEIGAVPANATTSKSTKTSIVLEDHGRNIRYTMTVTNNGGQSEAVNMNHIVFIDNLPEVADHNTIYSTYARKSNFAVNFIDNLGINVTVTYEDGTVRTLDADGFDVLLTDNTNFDVSTTDSESGMSAASEAAWSDQTLDATAGWYTLEECLEAGTLDSMRSIRVVVHGGTDADGSAILPANSTISVAFNAVAQNDEAAEETQQAINGFGYSYSISDVTGRESVFTSASTTVGVKGLSYPDMVKQLVDSDGNAVAADSDLHFQFLIYEGASKKLDAALGQTALLDALNETGVAATVAEVTVPAGQTSGTLMLSDLFVYKKLDGAWGPSSDPWVWSNDTQYTVMELGKNGEGVTGAGNAGAGDDESVGADASVSAAGAASLTCDGGFTPKTIGKTTGSYTFANKTTSSKQIVAVNERTSWEINVLKTGDDHGQALEGAWFALYEPAEADATDGTLSDAEVSALGADALATAPARTVEADGQRWQIAAVAKTDAAGCINWSGLMGQQYYVLELQAPNGYVIGGATEADGDSGEGSEGVTGDSGAGEASDSGAGASESTSSGAGASDTFANAGTIVASGSGQVVSQSSAVGGSCTLEVVNYLTYTLPNSGGPGVWPFVAAGLALIASALTLALFRRQRRLG
jgi:hypothetical protein